MKTKGKKGILGAFMFLAVFAASAAVVMLLWNWLIPGIIGWSAINFWQSAGLLLLCKLLFGGFGKMGHHHFGHHSHGKFSPDDYRRMRMDVKGMSPEERREYIRNNMFGGDPGGPCKTTDGGSEGK